MQDNPKTAIVFYKKQEPESPCFFIEFSFMIVSFCETPLAKPVPLYLR